MDIIITNLFNTINNSKFLSIVISVIIVILTISFTTYTIKLLSNIRAYIVNKSNSFYLENQKKTKRDTSSRIELTNDVLDLLSFMINTEIIMTMTTYVNLNTKYTISNLDADAADIAEKVFSGINKNIFVDPDLALTEEYLLSFITKKSIAALLSIVQQHNDTIKGIQSTED